MPKKTDPTKSQDELKQNKTNASAQHERADERGSGSASPSEVELIKNQLSQMTEMAKRTMADLHNLKRRQEDERRLIITMANVDLIRSLLPIIDNLDRAKKHVPQGAETWFQGIEMCINQLHKVLEDAGVKPIEAVGKTFDPDFHEAIMQGPGQKDIIIEELEKGYIMGDRVDRHAKVKVATGNP